MKNETSTVPEAGQTLAPTACSTNMCDCINKIRKELPDISPSAGYDEVDEVLGLLRVARLNAKSFHDETLALKKRIQELQCHIGEHVMLDIHACRKCGRPGATMHYPGGYLCSGGCETDSPNAGADLQPPPNNQKL